MARKYVDLSDAPWTMHEFFAGSGLVGYGLKGMFAPIWANDISVQKAAVYIANFGKEHFLLNDIRNIHGAELPYANMFLGKLSMSGLVVSGSFRWNSCLTQWTCVGMASRFR